MSSESFSYDTSTAVALGASYGYDATEDRGRRRPVRRTTHSEDEHADYRKRRILSATTRDLMRNHVVASWALRKHLDYISDFTFEPKTDDPGFNKDLREWMYQKMRPARFDVAGRHSMPRAVRLAEACRMKDGDVWWLKLTPAAPNYYRGLIQAIEGDRIHISNSEIPTGDKWTDWISGCKIGSDGETSKVAICKRDGSNLKLERIVDKRNILQHAFFERYDQVRGISPITAGLNWFRDTYEGFEYALARLKVEQLFGLKVTRAGQESFFGDGTATPTVDADGDGVEESGYTVDFNKGPFVLDMDPGDDAAFMTGNSPSQQTADFLKLMIHVALKSADIPYSFFDESFTNFYGSRGGLQQYLKSCKSKIADLQEFQDSWALWALGIGVADGEIVLPSGREFSWVDWEFVPAGVPWWDATKEARGAAMMVAMGLSSPQRICREIGTDFYKNIDETAEATTYASDRGVPLVFVDSSAFAPSITVGVDDNADGQQ